MVEFDIDIKDLNNKYKVFSDEEISFLVDNNVVECIDVKHNKRLCDNCGRYMTRGYVIENGCEYYCSDKCLHTRYSDDEYLKMYNDGEGDSYYTEWENEIKNDMESEDN